MHRVWIWDMMSRYLLALDWRNWVNIVGSWLISNYDERRKSTTDKESFTTDEESFSTMLRDAEWWDVKFFHKNEILPADAWFIEDYE